MNWLCRAAAGHWGVAPTGLKLVGGPHWKPATNRVSPDAPGRPFEVPPWVLLPVCAVPQPVAPTPIRAPPMASPVSERKRRRLVPHGWTGPVPSRAGPAGSISGLFIEFLPEDASLLSIQYGRAGGAG